MKKKILVITPKFPYPSYGACELDRAAGIELLIALGYEVYVITKVYAEEYATEALAVAKKLGISIVPVTYKKLTGSLGQKIWRSFKRIIQPWFLDGAAYEYSDQEMKQAVKRALDLFRPDLVWFDYTYLWPLYSLIRKRKLPVVTRSINFEPSHFLEEEGRTLWNYCRFLPKILSELIAVRKSDIILAITPVEAGIYKKIGARRVAVLPLRSLPRCLGQDSAVRTRKPLNVFFSGSTYNVAHNRKALEFLLAKVIPLVQSRFPGEFRFHIFGGKMPERFYHYFGSEIIRYDHLPYEKFVGLTKEMDIAAAPSLYGAGMQQKVFEPLARGIPTVTSPRALAGYPFRDRQELLLAATAEEFAGQLGALRDGGLRARLSAQAVSLAEKIFSKQAITHTVLTALQTLSA